MDSYLSRWTEDKDFVKLHNDFNLICNINNEMDNALYARIYMLRQLAKHQSISNPNLNFSLTAIPTVFNVWLIEMYPSPFIYGAPTES